MSLYNKRSLRGRYSGETPTAGLLFPCPHGRKAVSLMDPYRPSLFSGRFNYCPNDGRLFLDSELFCLLCEAPRDVFKVLFVMEDSRFYGFSVC